MAKKPTLPYGGTKATAMGEKGSKTTKGTSRNGGTNVKGATKGRSMGKGKC